MDTTTLVDEQIEDGERFVDHLRQILKTPDLGVIAHQNATRTQGLGERLNNQVQTTIDALAQCLDNQIVGVAIDDERRQAVGLSADKPVRVTVWRERLSVREGPP